MCRFLCSALLALSEHMGNIDMKPNQDRKSSVLLAVNEMARETDNCLDHWRNGDSHPKLP